MPLIGLHTRDPALAGVVRASVGGEHDVARGPSWSSFKRVLVERPVVVSVVDLDSFSDRRAGVDELRAVRASFPAHGLVVVARGTDDPIALFRLGQAKISELVLLSTDAVRTGLSRAVAKAGRRSASATVTRALSPSLPRRDLLVVRHALDHVHRSLGAEAFAAEVGYSRPFLSERLKESGLPSTGHLLTWVRLLHGGLWMGEPGRTGESVARQLEYANGSTFRRALRNYVGATPTEVRRRGGLALVLERFLDECGLSEERDRREPAVA